jgi:uncharacterized protein (DUF433 family)
MLETTRYIQNRDGNWYVSGSRVEVYSVIAAWNQGYSPEEVQSSFPVLSLVDIYGTILYYLEHRKQLDAFFRETDTQYHRLKAEAEAANPEFYATMRERTARYRAAQAKHDVAAS